VSPERPLYRSTAATSERAQDSRTVDAEKAEPAIRRAMLDGGSCTVEADGRRRVLLHEPAIDAPLKSWIWPFSLMSPHRVRFILYEDSMRATTMTYEKARIGEAIKYFLLGLPPRAKIAITRDRPTGGARS
jgi:hypothetical protein